jgi:hypothetical protein
MKPRHKPARLTERMLVRLPPALPRAVEIAAEKRFVSCAEYVRTAIITQLARDGVDILAIAA